MTTMINRSLSRNKGLLIRPEYTWEVMMAATVSGMFPEKNGGKPAMASWAAKAHRCPR